MFYSPSSAASATTTRASFSLLLVVERSGFFSFFLQQTMTNLVLHIYKLQCLVTIAKTLTVSIGVN